MPIDLRSGSSSFVTASASGFQREPLGGTGQLLQISSITGRDVRLDTLFSTYNEGEPNITVTVDGIVVASGLLRADPNQTSSGFFISQTGGGSVGVVGGISDVIGKVIQVSTTGTLAADLIYSFSEATR